MASNGSWLTKWFTGLQIKLQQNLIQVKFDIIIQRKVIQTVGLPEELEKVNASHSNVDFHFINGMMMQKYRFEDKWF